jgi:hypothetical protein
MRSPHTTGAALARAARHHLLRTGRPFVRRRPVRWAAVAGLVGIVAMTALVTGGPLAGAAADPFQAGQTGLEATTLSGAAAAPGLARAARTAGSLGLPVASRRSITHVTDRFAGSAYDEVNEFDAQDRLAALQRFDSGGRLLAAVRFGWTGDGGPALRDDAAARSRAERLVEAALGTPPVGAPRVARTPSDSGWTVSWTRTVDGIPVPGDGLRVQLWPDGSLHGFSRSERPLAPAPGVTIDADTARRLASVLLDRWFAGASRPQAVVTGISLAWTAPNDTFAPERPDAPASTLRLSWVVQVSTTGALSDTVRGLEIDLDAGDGSLLGGDVLR